MNSYIKINVEKVYKTCCIKIFFILKARCDKDKKRMKKYRKIRNRFYNKIILKLSGLYDISNSKIYKILIENYRDFPSVIYYQDYSDLIKLKRQCKIAMRNDIKEMFLSTEHSDLLYYKKEK